MKFSCSIISKQLLDSFVVKQYNSQILQSSYWSDFQKEVGKNCWHVGVFNGDHLIATASIIEQNIFAGLTYLYCPRGPIIEPTLTSLEKNEALKLLLGRLREITIETKNRDELFTKIEPTFVLPAVREVCVKSADVQPADTLIIDLHQNQEELLNSFHPKTRYNIKLSQKHDLKIVNNKNEFETAWPLFNKTSERSAFRLHDKNYYLKMLTHLPNSGLWLIKKDNNIIACAIVAYFGDTVTYLHGASDHQYRSLMAPYLLHWEIISWAKNNNFRWYDLHGIAPENKKNHPLNNVSRFKLGWGGKRVTYPGAYDLVYSPGLYNAYKIVKKINRYLRKFI